MSKSLQSKEVIHTTDEEESPLLSHGRHAPPENTDKPTIGRLCEKFRILALAAIFSITDINNVYSGKSEPSPDKVTVQNPIDSVRENQEEKEALISTLRQYLDPEISIVDDHLLVSNPNYYTFKGTIFLNFKDENGRTHSFEIKKNIILKMGEKLLDLSNSVSYIVSLEKLNEYEFVEIGYEAHCQPLEPNAEPISITHKIDLKEKIKTSIKAF